MKEYVPIEITEMAKKEAANFKIPLPDIDKSNKPSFNRVVRHDAAFAKNDRIKMKTMGTESISINKDMVDLRYMEQLTDSEQLNAIAQMIKHLKLNAWNGRLTVGDAVEQLYKRIEEKGFAAFIKGDLPGNLALPRKQELYGAINRCRGLIKID